MMTRIDISTARRKLGPLLSEVRFGGQRVIITRHGKDLAALVSLAELEQLYPQLYRGDPGFETECEDAQNDHVFLTEGVY